MTRIKPFKSVYYNADKVGPLDHVVCPPYDVISDEEQAEYYNLSPYNFIRILLGKDRNNDNKYENRYTRARKTFTDWVKKGVLLEDEKPSIYFYQQEFMVQGQKHHRLGFISLMKLENDGDRAIFPHEKTHMHAKEDRLRLWRMVKANLSSIFVCFSDRQKKVDGIFHKMLAHEKPFIDVRDNDGVRHKVWRFFDPASVKMITDTLADQPLFIADGHHRYEVAQEYRKQKLQRMTKATGKEPFNYLMTYFTNMDSSGLQIFPMHRIVKKLSGPLDFLEECFRVDKVKTKEDLLILLAKAGRNENAFGLYTRDGIKLLRLKNKLLIDQYVKEGSKEFRSLDATILKYFVLDRVGVKSEDIVYTKDLQLSTEMVDTGKAEASFIMNPVKIQELKSIALNGERMPPKTTYFYPKVLSGLTIHKLDD